MKKNATLLLIAVFSFFTQVQIFADEVVFPVSLDPADWSIESHGSGADVYAEDGSLILEVMTGVEFSWQGICYYVIDLDLDTYPNLRITVSEESSAAWNVKLFQPEMSDQTSPFGGDLKEYGTREFVVGDVTGQSGVSSFELWLWAIDYGQRVIVDQLEFFGEGGGSGIDDSKAKPCIVYTEKGRINFSGAEGKAVSIYTVSGQLINQTVTNYGKTSVDLQPGTYIVKIGSEVIKAIVL